MVHAHLARLLTSERQHLRSLRTLSIEHGRRQCQSMVGASRRRAQRRAVSPLGAAANGLPVVGVGTGGARSERTEHVRIKNAQSIGVIRWLVSKTSHGQPSSAVIPKALLRGYYRVPSTPTRAPAQSQSRCRNGLAPAMLCPPCSQSPPTHSVHPNRGLTLPSSGRSKGRFAPFGPPLMSNVRPLKRRREVKHATRGCDESSATNA